MPTDTRLPADGKVCVTTTAFVGDAKGIDRGKREMVYLWRDPRRPRSTGTGVVSFVGDSDDQCEQLLGNWLDDLDVTVVCEAQMRSADPFVPVEVETEHDHAD